MEKTFTAIPVLETDQFRLRGITKNDRFELFKFISDKDTMKYITSDPVSSVMKLEEKIHGQLASFSEQKEIPWVIINKINGDLVGTFSLYKIRMWHKKAEMGVVIRKEYQNTGVMTEILERILAFGFDTLGLNRIVGDIFAKNQGSGKLLIKYGFRKEGVLRQTDYDGEKYHDTVVYSLLKKEYEAGKIIGKQ